MNSEITKVSRLVPSTILSNKQYDLKASVITAVKEPQLADVPKGGLKAPADEVKTAAKDISLATVKVAAAEGNSIFQATKRDLEFQIDDSTKEVVVKIVDSQSGEVVQQIPTEQMLAFIKRMQELDGGHGTMLRDKA